ncbi:hypothetical protein FRC05_009862 [Tulasnella sp. 425]|nr:hypothetical protein FRC05_009862 [Tulasnella sp. 425]
MVPSPQMRCPPSLTVLTLTSTRCKPTLVAGSQDSIDGASRVPRFSAVLAVCVSPLVPTDVSPYTGAPAAPLHGAPVPSSALASVHVFSKSCKAPRSKVKPLPRSNFQVSA